MTYSRNTENVKRPSSQLGESPVAGRKPFLYPSDRSARARAPSKCRHFLASTYRQRGPDTSMINYSASYDVHIGLLLFLTSLCWNRHSEDSKKVRHLKIGPLVQKLQMIPHFCVRPGTGVHILGGTFVSRVYI